MITYDYYVERARVWPMADGGAESNYQEEYGINREFDSCYMMFHGVTRFRSRSTMLIPNDERAVLWPVASIVHQWSNIDGAPASDLANSLRWIGAAQPGNLESMHGCSWIRTTGFHGSLWFWFAKIGQHRILRLWDSSIFFRVLQVGTIDPLPQDVAVEIVWKLVEFWKFGIWLQN